MKNMKLVIATPLYPPEIGGPATYVKLLEEGLLSKGVEVHVVKFSCVRHLPKIVKHIAYYRELRKALKSADALLALDPVSTGLPACIAATRVKKPLVVKVVGDYAWEQGRQRFGITEDLDAFVRETKVPFLVRLLQKIQTYVARHATRVIVPSQYLKGIVTAWGIPQEKIEVIYNAVTIEKTGQVPEAVAVAPRPLIVSVGRLVPWKHVDSVIDAVAALHDAGNLGTLVIVGDGPEWSALKQRGEEKLPEKVIFTGSLSHADTLAVLMRADVLVLNSSYEGLSHLLVEAQTLLVPTIATHVGGNSEVITDGENGLLVRVGDTDALARTIQKVLSDDALRARVSVRSLESSKRFSVETMLTTTAAILEKI